MRWPINSNPKVAILLATYNGLKFIDAQINSILGQVDLDVTIFISDDFSTDGTWEYLNSINNPKIEILTRTTNYKSASGNFFKLIREVDFAPFDYVALSDQDDIWFNNKLLISLEEINKGADACSSDIIAYWNENKTQYIKKSQPIGLWNHLFESPGPGCTFFLKKELVLKFRDFLEKHSDSLVKISFHDWLLFAFARTYGFKWSIIPQATMNYRQHSTNIMGANSGFASYLRRYSLITTGWYFDQVFQTATLFNLHNSSPVLELLKSDFKSTVFLIQNVKHIRRKKIDQLLFVFLLLKQWLIKRTA